MFEQTNQTEFNQSTAEESAESNDTLDLLGDEDVIDTDHDDAGETQESGNENPAAAAGEQNTTEPDVLTAKYLGKEMPFDRKSVESIATVLGVQPGDVITQLQKGLNYDKVAEERERLRNAEEFAVLDHYAKIAGVPRAQYLEMLKQNQRQAEIEAMTQSVAQQYPEAPPAVLNELAQLRQQQQLETQRRQADEQRHKPWFELFEQFPEARGKELPQEVLTMVGNGARPVEAWLRHENNLIRQRNAADEQNAKNKQTAIGSLRGDSADGAKDPFDEGFFSVFGK